MNKVGIFSIALLLSTLATANVNLEIALMRNQEVQTGAMPNVAVGDVIQIHRDESVNVQAIVTQENEKDAVIRFAFAPKDAEGNYIIQATPEMLCPYNEITQLNITNTDDEKSSFALLVRITQVNPETSAPIENN